MQRVIGHGKNMVSKVILKQQRRASWGGSHRRGIVLVTRATRRTDTTRILVYLSCLRAIEILAVSPSRVYAYICESRCTCACTCIIPIRRYIISIRNYAHVWMSMSVSMFGSMSAAMFGSISLSLSLSLSLHIYIYIYHIYI